MLSTETVTILRILITFFFVQNVLSELYDEDIWDKVACDEEYHPPHCDKNSTFNLFDLDEYDRCGPGELDIPARNYFRGASGRRETCEDNKHALRKIKILPRLLRNVANVDTGTKVLGMKVGFPIGISPVGIQKLAHPDGELATLRGVSDLKTIMILSCYSNTRIEDVAKEAEGKPITLWMQTFIFKNRSLTADIIRRAEESGFKAIVVTCDTNVDATLTCNARHNLKLPPDFELPNIGPNFKSIVAADATYEDLTWVKSLTKLPIVAKGLLSGEDASRAILAGASAILVSNHGGRQLDSVIATIDALPGVVEAVKKISPNSEVYMDGGLRNGPDMYKAIARGAKMVFLGRSIIWGLAINGEEGVRTVMKIAVREFNETMQLSGATKPSRIKIDTLLPQKPSFECTN